MEFSNDFFIKAQGVIERVFRSAREELVKASGNIATEQKEDNTVVTELDKSVESKLREELKKFDPAIGIEGEEFGIEGSRGTYWLIDPIDGTEAFTRGLPYYRNMATLIDNDEPVFTVIYKPASDELYVAAKNEGAFRNALPIKVSNRELSESRIEVHSPSRQRAIWQLMSNLSQNLKGVRVSGDFLSVAEGKHDGLLVYKSGGGPWDFAPRGLIIREAGARVANLGSETWNFKEQSMLAANPIIFDDIMKIINEFEAGNYEKIHTK